MKKVCAVCSVKGGVGKTLLAINIAHRLAEKGKKVALIDCDIDNSNFATFTGLNGEIEITSDKKYKPYEWDGLKVFSMSLIAGRQKAVSMTGDRYAQILDDAVKVSDWGDVEYTILDLPAGSSDLFKIAMLEFADKLLGNIIIAQPAMVDATERTINLHRYLEIPILGLIENMSYFVCPEHENPKIFYPLGESTVDKIASKYGLNVLGKIPLSEEIAKNIVSGNPLLPEKYLAPVDNAVKVITEAKIAKTSLEEKIKAPILGKIKAELQSILIAFLLKIKQDFNIDEIRKTKGFTQEKPFLLTITDETGTKEITKLPLRLTSEGFKVLKKPENIAFEIVTDYKTLARAVMGYKKVGGKLIPFNASDAWLMGDVKIYGSGHSTMAVDALRKIFNDQNLMGSLREKYGKILERWI